MKMGFNCKRQKNGIVSVIILCLRRRMVQHIVEEFFNHSWFTGFQLTLCLKIQIDLSRCFCYDTAQISQIDGFFYKIVGPQSYCFLDILKIFIGTD